MRKRKFNRIHEDLEDLKQESEEPKTLDMYIDDNYMREILEAYDNQDPEFLAEIQEVEQMIIASHKPLMPWDFDDEDDVV